MFNKNDLNPLIKPLDEYKRDLEIIDASLNDQALYLASMTGDKFEDCLEFVKVQSRPDGEFPLTNPATLILNKNKFGDRELKEVTFMGFLNRVKKENLLLSPSLTAYVQPEVRLATHAQYIEGNVNNRSRVKNEQIYLEGVGTPEAMEQAKNKKGEQENYKGNNNSYSGATVSAATILYYKSTHSSLTSTCRGATSYANANNEKFIIGNRHYYNFEITKGNLLSIANLTDLDRLANAMVKFNLHYPTADECVEMVLYSTTHYVHNPDQTAIIKRMLSGFSPLQRAAVMYVGDLYHLYKHNKGTIKTFLNRLSSQGTVNHPDDAELYKACDSNVKMLAKFICYESVRGRNEETLAKESPEVLLEIYSTARSVTETLNHYRDLLVGVFLSTNVPSSIHAFPTAARKTAVLSDTDSTIFTLKWWVQEFFGKISYSTEAKQLVFALVFLVAETVTHILAIQSINMGVANEKIPLLAMKNEYYFALLALTTSAKHYFASQDALEGVMFEKPRMEIKGVGLRDSKVPPKIIKASKRMMEDIINTVKSEQPIDILKYLKQIANLERNIIKSIQDGSAEYLTTGQCKKIEAYKSEDNATFAKHLQWVELFAPSYGRVEDPPYTFMKLSVTADNKTRFNEWVESLEDKAMAMRLKTWLMEDPKRKGFTNFHIPFSVIENMGVPNELSRIADTRKIIANVMKSFYIILETLGIYLIDVNVTRLVSDYY